MAAEINSSENPVSTILIVEDNEEMLHFLKDIFSSIYKVETAIDGLNALEKVKELQPDIVLSDVMMPNMSGKELCAKLKTNFETSHIPVVLLTADSSEEQNLESLMLGADDYITKPFNVKALISRCNNLVLSRKRMQDKFSKQTDNVQVSLATNKMDQELLNKATQIVTKYIDDSEFDVSIFASEMALGRSKLYLKIKGITGMTPNDFILNIRLKTAASMLTNETELNISDITYRLGFSTPRYFSKCFKELFGLSPLHYRKANNPAFAQKEIEEEDEADA
jgi:DNA-binding response OmpR family regulator